MAIQRTSSLLAAQEAFGANNSDPKCHSTSIPLTTATNEQIIAMAKTFLSTTCPQLLQTLDSHPDTQSSADRLVKIGRNIQATLHLHNSKQDDATPSLDRLITECQSLAHLLNNPTSVPKVRYGRTELQMPIVSLGCMRFQQSWNRGGVPVTDMKQVQDECQTNLVNILKHAIHCGMNHIETALGYGCSELQLGDALKRLFQEGIVKREDLIIQTKGFVSGDMSKSDYKSSILSQIDRLGVGYIDLFSVHGVNTEDHLSWLFESNGEKGNLIEAVRELREEGKIRWIGFSTHAPAHVIKRAIETDAFDYINLHYHFEGSYTASGDGDESFEGNLQNIRLANKHDMGIFIISPYDKGGRLYAPSHQLRQLTLPEMEPIDFGSYWLWYHNEHKKGNEEAHIHTIVSGAARPSDLDQPVLAALRMANEPAATKADFETVNHRIQKRRELFGKDWADSWHVGLPNYTHSPQKGAQIGNMVWLYNVVHMFGLLDFAKDRNGTLMNNLKSWDTNKAWKENVFANPGFNWMPGCGYDPTADYSEELKDVPEKNLARVKEAMEFVRKWCVSDSKEDVPLEWQTAYDMRPWTAFPERS